MTPTTAPTAPVGPAPDRAAPEDPGGPRSAALRILLDDLLAERFGARPAAARRNRHATSPDDGEGAP